ncbi:GAF domain-containing protein [Candidatus Nitrospira allomarina]|uniref:GAF domain-containing protein n=1 Tax=Candidatus Nitrospira allomarina TaxID=3020900 RepID=A0AA96JSN7_9BACT|nr:GAF domain-containing protein [Candidatus Nitrospira allomarina]WNM58767.1 GAF domain-containing protein [Candidatus Nitrospira allomarina]
MIKPLSAIPVFSITTIGYVVLMGSVALVISVVDGMFPLGVSISEAYAVLVLLGFTAKDKRLIYGGAIAGTILTLEGAFISDPGVPLWMGEINRALSIFIIWLVAVFALGQLRFIEEQKESEKMKMAYNLLKQETTFLKLNQEIAVLSNTNDPVEDALKQAMKVICDYTGWPVAHLYIRDGDNDLLSPGKIWILRDWSKFDTFRQVTESTKFVPGEGLPGRVLASGKAAWIKNVTKDPNFPRARLAKEIGVKAGFAFPILIGPKVVAVMEFFSEEAMEPDGKLLDVMEIIGYLLGRIFERDHAGLKRGEYEDHLRRLYGRIKAVRELEDVPGGHKRTAEGIHDELR